MRSNNRAIDGSILPRSTDAPRAGGLDAMDRDAARDALEKARADLYRAEAKILERLMPEAFAVVREASARAIGQTPRERQVLGGVLMQRANIAEMYTGEGKT